MPPKKGLKPAVTPVNEPEPGIESPPTPHDPPSTESSGGKSPSKIKILKTSKDEIPLGEKEPSIGPKSSLPLRKKRITKKSPQTQTGSEQELVDGLSLKQEPSVVSLTKKKVGTKKWTFKKKKSSQTGSKVVEGLPLKQEPSVVSLTKKKKIGPKKWKFWKKSSQTGTEVGGIVEPPLKKDLSKQSLTKKKFGFRKKIRVAPSNGRISMKSKKSGSIKGSESIKTLEDLRVARSLFKLGTSDEDEENQKVWSLRAALRDPKTLLLLGLVLFLLVTALIAVTVIFAFPRGGGNNTTSTTVTMTTRFFNRGCGPRPKPENSTRLGKWCACFWKEDKDPVKECLSCCKRRNATDIPLCRNECPPPP